MLPTSISAKGNPLPNHINLCTGHSRLIICPAATIRRCIPCPKKPWFLPEESPMNRFDYGSLAGLCGAALVGLIILVGGWWLSDVGPGLGDLVDSMQDE